MLRHICLRARSITHLRYCPNSRAFCNIPQKGSESFNRSSYYKLAFGTASLVAAASMSGKGDGERLTRPDQDLEMDRSPDGTATTEIRCNGVMGEAYLATNGDFVYKPTEVSRMPCKRHAAWDSQHVDTRLGGNVHDAWGHAWCLGVSCSGFCFKN